MNAYRASYAKTLVAALVGLGAAAVALLWVASRPWFGPPWPLALWVGWGLVLLALVAAAGILKLIAIGGIIALHRDSLEARGGPYASGRRREGRVSVVGRTLSRILRALGLSKRDLSLTPGEMVRVKSLDEILATLDVQGTVDSLPFMPEMAASCGKEFRVFRRVEKTYDYVWQTGLRRLHNTVLLEGLRCNGSGHGGCQASCHILWKEAWLIRKSAPTAATAAQGPLTAADLPRLAQRGDVLGFVCQITALAGGTATTPLRWRDPRHYLRDLIDANVRLGPFLVGGAIKLFNVAQRIRGGVSYPIITHGKQAPPQEVLRLKPGELVRIRSKREIQLTLNERNRNKGLWFDRDMLRYCGGQYRVEARVERLIDEKTGQLTQLKNPCISLEGVNATGEYLAFCPQDESLFWREGWLERAQS